eukprot:1825386-Rhodomonas_salina.1
MTRTRHTPWRNARRGGLQHLSDPDLEHILGRVGVDLDLQHAVLPLRDAVGCFLQALPPSAERTDTLAQHATTLSTFPRRRHATACCSAQNRAEGRQTTAAVRTSEHEMSGFSRHGSAGSG